MPTNVSGEYYAAELEYKRSKTLDDKLTALRKMLALVPKHKGTENLVRDIKKRLSKLRSQLSQTRSINKRSSFQGFNIPKTADALIAILGFTNTGKSLLLSKLTNARPKIADYAFTTKKPEIGVINLNGAKLQIAELPALIGDYSQRDKQLLSSARNADLLLLVVRSVNESIKLLDYLYKNNFRFRERPKIVVKKTGKPRIVVSGLIKNIKVDYVKKIALKYISSGDLIFKYETTDDCLEQDLKDVLNHSLAFSKALLIINSFDKDKNIRLITTKNISLYNKACNNYEFLKIVKLSINSFSKLSELEALVMRLLDIVRVVVKIDKYSSQIVKTLPPNSSLKDLAEILGTSFVKNRFARLFGINARFQGQRIGMNYKLKDMDIIEFHI